MTNIIIDNTEETATSKKLCLAQILDSESPKRNDLNLQLGKSMHSATISTSSAIVTCLAFF
jgi:hypothetical protein